MARDDPEAIVVEVPSGQVLYRGRHSCCLQFARGRGSDDVVILFDPSPHQDKEWPMTPGQACYESYAKSRTMTGCYMPAFHQLPPGMRADWETAATAARAVDAEAPAFSALRALGKYAADVLAAELLMGRTHPRELHELQAFQFTKEVQTRLLRAALEAYHPEVAMLFPAPEKRPATAIPKPSAN